MRLLKAAHCLVSCMATESMDRQAGMLVTGAQSAHLIAEHLACLGGYFGACQPQTQDW